MRIYYFASTHWDREWYLPFQGFRVKLLETAERIADNLENVPGYDRFTFDGQTIVLEDIAEIRPDLAERLRTLAAKGKLNIGPWYTMPDELLVSGESLIRNLLAGAETARQYGHEPWPVGYVCDIFGHIAQLPQILAGFGIGIAVASRGVAANLPYLIKWSAPDGTHCRLLKQFRGYGNFLPISGRAWTKDEFIANFPSFLEPLLAFSPETVFLFDGQDHAIPSSQTPELRRWMKEALPEAEIIDSDLTDISEPTKGCVSGELTETWPGLSSGVMKLVQNSLSSRYDIKYANDQAQNQLELLLEPFLFLRMLQGKADYTDLNLLHFAWKTLLKNHAHDGICGCSIDRTHSNMMVRFSDVEEITKALVRKVVEKKCVGKRPGCGEFIVEIFNPLPYARQETVRLELSLPTDFPSVHQEPRAPESFAQFTLTDEQGREVPYARLSVSKNNMPYVPCTVSVFDVYRIAAEIELSPLGWTQLFLKASETPVRSFGTLRTGKLSAENEKIAFLINQDGTIDVTDKRSGTVRRGFNTFLLDNDCGDGWYYVSPVSNGTLSGVPSEASVKVTVDTECHVEFEITQYYRFARELEFRASPNALYSGIFPSERTALLPIRTTVSMNKNSASLDISTVVDNCLKDFRLRLSVPTGFSGNWFSSQAFTIIERKPGRNFGERTRKDSEAEVEEKNFSGIAGKSSPDSSFAFLSAGGLHEIACPAADPECLYVTLLRAVRRTLGTEGEPDGELQGKLEFRYRYVFSDAPTDYTALYREQQALQAPTLSTMNCGSSPVMENPENTPRISGNVVVSCMKPTEDGKGVVIRMFNPSDCAETVSVSRAAHFCDMNESAGERVPSAFSVGPWKIITLRMDL